jgi:hypothetical protein
MIFISLIIFILAMVIFYEQNMLYSRISAIILSYTGALSLNALYIQSIGSGIGIYGGLFQFTLITLIYIIVIIFLLSLLLNENNKIYIKNIIINNIVNFFSIILHKLFIIISINKSPFKNVYFIIFLLIGVITSIIIRLDYLINILNQLPYELMISCKLISALYSIILLFLFIINFKYCLNLIKLYYYNNFIYNNKFKLDNSILFFYLLYFFYIFLFTIIISVINYYSILTLNIKYLNIIYICLSIISLIIGIYYAIYYINSEIDLNKTLSLTGKVCFISFILIYLCLFIGLRSGIILDYFNKWEFFNTIHCDSTSPSRNNLNNILRKGENNNPALNNNPPLMNSSENKTESIISPENNISSELTSSKDILNRGNKNNLSLLDKGKSKLTEATGLFTDSKSPLKSSISPLNNSPSSSLKPIISRSSEESSINRAKEVFSLFTLLPKDKKKLENFLTSKGVNLAEEKEKFVSEHESIKSIESNESIETIKPVNNLIENEEASNNNNLTVNIENEGSSKNLTDNIENEGSSSNLTDNLENEGSSSNLTDNLETNNLNDTKSLNKKDSQLKIPLLKKLKRSLSGMFNKNNNNSNKFTNILEEKNNSKIINIQELRRSKSYNELYNKKK